MLEMKITITAADLAAAINNLAAALSGSKTLPDDRKETPVPVADSTQPVPLATTKNETIPTADPIVPTAAPQYTLEMIATAGASLVDAGKMDALCSLLDRYGVDNITALNPAQYGAFATELRALGAKI